MITFESERTAQLGLAMLLSAFVAACGGGSENSYGPVNKANSAPTVGVVTPANNTAGVPVNSAVTATFSEAMAASVASDFAVTCAAPCQSPTGTVTLDSTNTIATFHSATTFMPLTVYTVKITAAMSLAGQVLASPMTWNFTTGAGAAAAATLASAATFGAFGGTAGLTNSGTFTTINGDIGTTAISTSVTGFNDAGAGCVYTETPLNIGVVTGTIFTAAPPPSLTCTTEGTTVTAAVAAQARADALAAYNALVADPAGPDPGAGNLGSLVLAPGVYTSASGSFKIEGGDLTLDAKGDANAVWVFQMASTLTVGGPGAAFPQSVTLVNGALAKNVFWQVGSAATINAGGGGTMEGTIVAQAGAAFSTAGNTQVVTLNGRVLSLGPVVSLVNTVINVPAP
jgi:hypothetical protein